MRYGAAWRRLVDGDVGAFGSAAEPKPPTASGRKKKERAHFFFCRIDAAPMSCPRRVQFHSARLDRWFSCRVLTQFEGAVANFYRVFHLIRCWPGFTQFLRSWGHFPLMAPCSSWLYWVLPFFLNTVHKVFWSFAVCRWWRRLSTNFRCFFPSLCARVGLSRPQCVNNGSDPSFFVLFPKAP